jgi:histone acetyltransferase (RNA polymerase elongator complex component)
MLPQKWGRYMKHYVIPIFIPHYGCTQRCVFCNQRKITGVTTFISPENIAATIEEHLGRITKPRRIEVAFYGGSFTALPVEMQSSLLAPAYRALDSKQIQAIRLSTRPDCIQTDILDNLLRFGVSIIELGVQSLDDQVLQNAARGHTCADVIQAVALIKSAGIRCGIQLMPGLPGEDWRSMLNTARKAIQLRPDFARIYPTLVIANTELAKWYRQDIYHPLSLAEGVARASFLKLLFEQQQIPVIRTGLQATEELAKQDVVLAGPYHPAFGEMVDAYLFYSMVAQCIEHIFQESTPKFAHIIIHHHTKDSSKLRGLANANITRWLNEYQIAKITMLPDGRTLGELHVEYRNILYVINRRMLSV